MPAPADQIDRRIGKFHHELVGFFRRRVPGDPEEAAQEVWLRVAKANPVCEDDAAFRAYAYTVARRLVIDLHRRRAARVELVAIEDDRPDREDPGALRPGDRLEAEEVVQVVERELSSMKPEISQVFRWRAEDDVPFKEIAERHGCSINTALGRMHRATLKIAAALRAAGLLEVGDE